MANIANLAVQLTAKTGAFTKSMSKAGASVKQLAGNVAKVGAAMAAAGAAGLTAIVASNAKALDALGKTSAKLGESTENMQAFHHANKLAGVGVDTANMALQRMTRRVSEAAMGTGEAKGALKELGLSATELSKKSPVEAFKDISEAISQVGNQSDRVRLAMKLFDSEGVALVNTMAGGAAAINSAKNEIQALGGAVNAVDVRGVEMMNDAWTRVDAAVTAFGTKLTTALAPAVTALINKGLELIKSYGGFGAIGTKVATLVVEGAIMMARGIAKVVELAFQAKAGFMLMGAGALDAVAWASGAFEKLWAGIKIGAFTVGQIFFDVMTTVFEQINDLFESVIGRFRGISDTTDAMIDRMTGTNPAADAMRNAAEFFAEGAADAAKEVEGAGTKATRALAEGLRDGAKDALADGMMVSKFSDDMEKSIRNGIQGAATDAAESINQDIAARENAIRGGGPTAIGDMPGSGGAQSIDLARVSLRRTTQDQGVQKIENANLENIDKNMRQMLNQGIKVVVG